MNAVVCFNCGWEHDREISAVRCCPMPRPKSVEDVERDEQGAITDCREVAKYTPRK
jgi:hypothetical protein